MGICLVFVLLSTGPAYAQSNLLTNGDFATNITGWTTGSGNWSYNAGGNPGGSARNSITAGTLYQAFTPTDGGDHAVSVQFQTTTCVGTKSLIIRRVSDSAIMFQADSTATGSSYVTLSGSVTLSTVQYRFEMTEDCIATLWDNASVTLSATPTPSNTPTYTPTPSDTPTPTLTPSNTPTYTPTPSNTPTFTPTPTGEPPCNIIANCHLQYNAASWGLDSAAWQETGNPGGSGLVSADGVIWQDFTGVPGLYELRFDMSPESELLFALYEDGVLSDGGVHGSSSSWRTVVYTITLSALPWTVLFASNEGSSFAIDNVDFHLVPPTPTPSHTPTNTPTNTPTATEGAAETLTATNTPTATYTPGPTATPTLTITPTATYTPGPTATPTITPTVTATGEPTSITIYTIDLPSGGVGQLIMSMTAGEVILAFSIIALFILNLFLLLRTLSRQVTA